MKVIEDKNRRIYHYLRLEKSILSKWLYYQKQSTDSMQSVCNYQWQFFTELAKTHLKIWMETQKANNRQSKLEKEKWSWRNDTLWLQTILQSSRHIYIYIYIVLIMTSRLMNQWIEMDRNGKFNSDNHYMGKNSLGEME